MIITNKQYTCIIFVRRYYLNEICHVKRVMKKINLQNQGLDVSDSSLDIPRKTINTESGFIVSTEQFLKPNHSPEDKSEFELDPKAE